MIFETGGVDWAIRAMIKEAYGFGLAAFVQESWRKALNKESTYNFEDTNGVFPVDDAPEERRSLYHYSQRTWILEYEAKHGLTLVYDKELTSIKEKTKNA